MKWRTTKVVPAYAGNTATLQQKKGYWAKRFSKNLWMKVFNKVKSPETYVGIISALLIILFIYTGLNKMLDFNNFKFQMGRSPFIKNINGFLAVLIPLGELIISLALIFNKTRLIGLLLSSFLMALFTGYIYIMLHYSFDLPCSCGGILAAMSWEDHLIFNSICTSLAILASIIQSNINSNIKFQPRQTISRNLY